MEKEIKRSLKFSLEFANTGKKRFLDQLWEEYKKVLQYFIDLGWERKNLPSYEDVKAYPYETWLSKRYLSNALQQTQAILKSCLRKLKKKKDIKKPEIKNISLKLDDRVFKFEKSQNTFDYWFKLRDSKNEKMDSFSCKEL